MQQLGACLDDARRQRQVGLTVERFIAAFLERQEKLPRRNAEDPQLLWDATFLRRLARLWETTAKDVLERVDANIAHWREVCYLLLGHRLGSLH